jgi:peptidoglycan/LPS O-acetylase OafA/YrhL
VSTLDRRFFTYFLAGACAYLYRDRIRLRLAPAMLALSLLVAAWPTPYWHIICPVALTYLALYIGYVNPVGILRWCDKTDLSYGVYLYAFPLQQLIAVHPWGRAPWVMLLIATPATLIAAWLSWHLVEKKFLGLKSAGFVDRDPGALPPPSQSTANVT